MAEAPKITTVGSMDDVPGGLIPEGGQSAREAADGLFDVLGSEGEEFYEEPQDDGSPTDDDLEGEDDDGSAPDDDDLEGEDDEFADDESDDDGDEGEGFEELSDDTLISGVPLPGGETTEVSLEELKLGYSRQQDYTRKRQAASEEHSNAMAETRETRDQYRDRLTKVSSILEQMGPAVPTQDLRISNPGEYAAQLAEHQAYQDAISMVSGATQEISAQEQQELQRSQQDHVMQEWGKMTEALPTWTDQAVATKELTDLRQYAIDTHGFTPQEIDSVTDSRLLLLLKSDYDLKQGTTAAAESVENKRAKAKKRLAPGGRKIKGSKKSRQRKAQGAADQRAAATGNVRDAARAIELALGDEL